MRVVSWNVAFRAAAAAESQGRLLRGLHPDLVLLQEVNPSSAATLRRAAGMDWLILAVDLRVPGADDRPVRSRGVAIAGRGQRPRRSWLPANAPLPERILLAETGFGGSQFTAIAYHAPPGVNWGPVKPQQAVALASWLAAQPGPVVLGVDANTPLIDALDFAETRTHWHSGDRHLQGAPGDDLLFGPGKLHALDDALRRWLASHPADALGLSPSGPLAVTHRTGRRKNSPGTGRRFDSIWVSEHWAVEHIEHLYDDGIAAGSDHAVVVADLAISSRLDRTVIGKHSSPPIALPRSALGRPSPPRNTVTTAQPGGSGLQVEFIPGHYCRDCGWPFAASQRQTRCKVPQACQRRQALPLDERTDGCPRNDRVHPEWRDAVLARTAST